MNNRFKLALALLLLTVATFIADTSRTNAQLKKLPSVATRPPQARIVVTKTDLKPPIKITTVNAKKGQVDSDKQFLDYDDDWIRGLTIRLINNSGKAVTFVEVSGTFHREEDQKQGLPGGWPFRKGIDPFGPEVSAGLPKLEPVLPGDQIEIVLSDLEYQEIIRFLGEVGFPDSIRRLELAVTKIGFSDGTAWNTGATYKRDPTNIKGPLKGWAPMEGGGAEPEGRKSPGSVTKDFLTSMRRSHISASDQRRPP